MMLKGDLLEGVPPYPSGRAFVFLLAGRENSFFLVGKQAGRLQFEVTSSFLEKPCHVDLNACRPSRIWTSPCWRAMLAMQAPRSARVILRWEMAGSGPLLVDIRITWLGIDGYEGQPLFED